MTYLTTSLLGRRCRPTGMEPFYSHTKPSDYYLEVVGVLWDDLRDTSGLVLFVVNTRNGASTSALFQELEFEPQDEEDHVH